MRLEKDPEGKGISEREPAAVVIFDGDDTLWETEPLYDDARSEAASIVSRASLDGERFEELQRAIDIDNVAGMGLSPDRFPTSSVQAYERLARDSGASVNKSISRKIFLASAHVFERVAPLRRHAQQVLEQMKTAHRLVLLTKGDPDIQRKRIAESGLAHHFIVISIVADKDTTAFTLILRRLNARRDTSWSVGNSLPSDILPAIEIGMSAIWIETHVWGHERLVSHGHSLNPRLHVATDLSEVPTIIGEAALGRGA